MATHPAPTPLRLIARRGPPPNLGLVMARGIDAAQRLIELQCHLAKVMALVGKADEARAMLAEAQRTKSAFDQDLPVVKNYLAASGGKA